MNDRPKIKNRVGEKGVRILRDKIEDELGWLFREQPLETDYGIDAHIEIVDGDEVTGRLIAVQIKAGKSFFKYDNGEGFIFRGDIKHYNYWVNHSLPVILVLCNVDTKECYWVQIKEENVTSISSTSWKIVVPKNQMIAKDSHYVLKRISENKTLYERKLDKLNIEKPWMDEILKGNKVIIESEEWVNKSSGRSSLRVKVIDEYTGNEKVEVDWPYILLPGFNYGNALAKLFPWATLSIDEDFYDDYDTEMFCLENAFYDDEEDKWVYDRADLRSYKRRLPDIRPYSEDGEVASYRLVLELNELGNAFLTVDRFLKAK